MSENGHSCDEDTSSSGHAARSRPTLCWWKGRRPVRGASVGMAGWSGDGVPVIGACCELGQVNVSLLQKALYAGRRACERSLPLDVAAASLQG